MNIEELPLCKCGCGEQVAKKGNRFIFNHHFRGRKHSQETKDKLSKKLTGVPKPPRSPEHCKALSKAHTGVPLSPEHIAARTKGQKGKSLPPLSDAHKNAISETMMGRTLPLVHCDAISKGNRKAHKNRPESWDSATGRMRGGNDLVNHHYLYDHSDLSKYTMKVTRSKHAQIHAWMRKAGIKIPHINIKKVDHVI